MSFSPLAFSARLVLEPISIPLHRPLTSKASPALRPRDEKSALSSLMPGRFSPSRKPARQTSLELTALPCGAGASGAQMVGTLSGSVVNQYVRFVAMVRRTLVLGARPLARRRSARGAGLVGPCGHGPGRALRGNV